MLIGNTPVAEPSFEGITVRERKIHAPNWGKSIKQGKQVGDTMGRKNEITVKWSVLTYEQFTTIRDAIINSAEFFSFTYPYNNTTVTNTVYVEEIPRTFYSPLKKNYYKDITITFMEQ